MDENINANVVLNRDIKYKSFLLFCILGLLGLSFANTAFAKVRIFPHGCRSVGYSFQNYLLVLKPKSSGGSQSIYFIHNKSQHAVKFHHMKTGEEAYVMHLNNQVAADQWGVIAVDAKRVKLICSKPSEQSKHGRIVDCRQVIQLCEYNNVKFSVINQGSYWAIKSNVRKAAIRGIVKQGILLRW